MKKFIDIILKTNPLILFFVILLVLVSIVFPLTNCLNSITYRLPEATFHEDSVSLSQDSIIEIERALQKTIRRDLVTEQELNDFFRNNEIILIEDLEMSTSAGLTERISGDEGKYMIRVGDINNERILQHEFVHLALLAGGAGLFNDTHHRIMRENGLCFSACP